MKLPKPILKVLQLTKSIVSSSLVFLALISIAEVKAENPAFILDLPLYDSPYNTELDLKNPSMTQALQFSKGFYQFSHSQLQSFWGDRTDAGLLSIIFFDIIASWMPLSNGWLHEEWHRNIMGQYGINSRNDIYELEFFTETISVSNVNDDDLITLKAEHPADMIRLHSAGLESQNQLNLSLEIDQFFHNTQSIDGMLMWINNVNTTAYLNACSTHEANEITNNILGHENQDINQRDFTGLDCNAWVYDLFKPDEPYDARGTHPSGNGINRYITYEQLTVEERRYLRRQYYLSLLNFLDPFLINKRYFSYQNPSTGKNITWNANVKHYLSPFGYTVNMHAFIQNTTHNYLFTLSHYFNKNRYFPGIGLRLINVPVNLHKTHVYSSVNIRLWQQPEQQSFTTAKAQTGGSISTRFEVYRHKKIGAYLNIAHKTSGWLEGNTYLGPNTSILLGILYRA